MSHRRHYRQISLLAAAAAAGLGVAALAPLAQASPASARPAMVVRGQLPTFTRGGPIEVTVYADPSVSAPLDTRISSPVIGGPVTLAAGTRGYSVDIGQSAALAAATRGIVNYMVVASTPTQVSNVFGWMAVTSKAAVAVSQLTRATPMAAPVLDSHAWSPSHAASSCGWIEISKRNNVSTRIGELHVANSKKVVGTYEYEVKADSTFTIGENFAGGSFSDDGHNKISNSLGAGGTDPHRGNTDKYIDAGFNYGKYNGYGCMAGHQKVQANSSNADPFDGKGKPRGNPWKTCHKDPHGYAIVSPAADSGHPGTWNADRSTAKDYDNVATVYDFSFGGTTGYTSSINIEWQNYSTKSRTYVCGNAAPVQDSAVLYNGNS